MRYLIFLENRDYTDETGAPSTLWDHLEYLRQYGGTPDSFEAHEDLNVAKSAALKLEEPAIVIDDLAGYRPVFRHLPADSEDAPSP